MRELAAFQGHLTSFFSCETPSYDMSHITYAGVRSDRLVGQRRHACMERPGNDAGNDAVLREAARSSAMGNRWVAR